MRVGAAALCVCFHKPKRVSESTPLKRVFCGSISRLSIRARDKRNRKQ
jgi:hypothetical protein